MIAQDVRLGGRTEHPAQRVGHAAVLGGDQHAAAVDPGADVADLLGCPGAVPHPAVEQDVDRREQGCGDGLAGVGVGVERRVVADLEPFGDEAARAEVVEVAQQALGLTAHGLAVDGVPDAQTPSVHDDVGAALGDDVEVEGQYVGRVVTGGRGSLIVGHGDRGAEGSGAGRRAGESPADLGIGQRGICGAEGVRQEEHARWERAAGHGVAELSRGAADLDVVAEPVADLAAQGAGRLDGLRRRGAGAERQHQTDGHGHHGRDHPPGASDGGTVGGRCFVHSDLLDAPVGTRVRSRC